jgi:adenosine deaminase CECR1
MEEYMKQRAELLEASRYEHFARDIVLHKSELNAQRKLK